jgi:hypothetical protein
LYPLPLRAMLLDLVDKEIFAEAVARSFSVLDER